MTNCCDWQIFRILIVLSCKTNFQFPVLAYLYLVTVKIRVAGFSWARNNNPSYSRILIGCCLWSIRGKTHNWRLHYKVFPSVFYGGFLQCLRDLSPGQTDSQVDASWKLGSTCDSVRPGLACTCADLQWLAHTLVDIKFAHKSTQVFHRLATQPKSKQVGWRPLTYHWAIKLWICLTLNGSFCDLRVLERKLASLFGHPTQVSRQVQLAATCDYLPACLARALVARATIACQTSVLFARTKMTKVTSRSSKKRVSTWNALNTFDICSLFQAFS